MHTSSRVSCADSGSARSRRVTPCSCVGTVLHRLRAHACPASAAGGPHRPQQSLTHPSGGAHPAEINTLAIIRREPHMVRNIIINTTAAAWKCLFDFHSGTGEPDTYSTVLSVVNNPVHRMNFRMTSTPMQVRSGTRTKVSTLPTVSMPTISLAPSLARSCWPICISIIQAGAAFWRSRTSLLGQLRGPPHPVSRHLLADRAVLSCQPRGGGKVEKR